MPEESLVARLREYADVTADMRSLPLLREAADALERAEKERFKKADDVYRAVGVAALSVEINERWEDSWFRDIGRAVVAARLAFEQRNRALSPSTKDETK